MTATVRKGDRFTAPGGTVTVLRVGFPWVDIRVTQPNGATWTKRMPNGIPADWQPADPEPACPNCELSQDEVRGQRFEAYVASEVEQGRCPYSGLMGPECKSWLCDCFDFEDIWGVSQK